jgi:integrase
MTRQRGTVAMRSGKWAYRFAYMDRGKRRYLRQGGFATKEAARRALTKALHDTDNGDTFTARGTVESYLNEWVETYTKSGKVKPSSAAKNRDHVRLHLNPRIGAIELSKLTGGDVARLYADLLSNGRLSQGNIGKPLSPKTVRNIANTLHKALSDGVKWAQVSRNVADGIDLPRWERPDLVVWDSSQIREFLDYVSDDYLGPLWRLFLTTGMRRGEILGLRWSDLDMVDKMLTVRESRVQVGRATITTTPKTKAGRRNVSLDETTVVALASLKNAQADAKDRLGSWSSDLVATDLDGSPIEPDSISRRFQRTAKLAGLPVPRLHDLRHSAAVLMLSQGVPVHIVAGRLGHANPSITLSIYAHFLPSADKLAADVIGDALSSLNGREMGANLIGLSQTKHS